MSNKNHPGIKCKSCEKLYLPFQLNEEGVCIDCISNRSAEFSHKWEPTDSNGHNLICTQCGLETNIYYRRYQDDIESACQGPSK